MAASIGLIAGSGGLPVYFATQAKRKGYSVKTAAIRGAASQKLEKLSDEITWISIGQVGALLSFLKRHQIRKAVMHGKVQHASLFKNLKLDWKALALWVRLQDRSGEALLQAVAGELSKGGVKLLDSRFLMEGVLVKRGWIVPGKIDSRVRQSVAYGLRRARTLAQMGVGQTLVVKREAVVAVEGMEGTDETIRRAGAWAGPGTVAVKVSSPRQDWRFDVPTVGLKTLQSLARAKARGIVVEAGRAFLLEPEKSAAFAKKNGLFILAV